MISFIEKYREPLTKGMAILVLIASFVFDLIGKIFVNFFNINETMGWKLSIMNTWVDNIPLFSLLIFSGLYLFFLFFKIKTNLILSVFHLFLISLSSFLFNFWELDLRFILSVICLSVLIFGANLFKSFVNKDVV
ncbi:hypothetical protein [Polaribacter sp. SA4-12]|uniref:hypothetical protein n=1 Tax=Polaribacter sp. SA4-12 TaxID=1312072 RepID=UPI0012F73B2F|nr:hypothetical protein [Polaribacter sp. SA4-12]